MEATNKNYCIILAGGIGRRLWPVSTKEVPKQFLDFFGTGKSLLQQTFERFVRFIPRDHIFVSTYQNYVPLVSEQLPDLPGQNILPEPVQLNTAPAAIWGTWHTVLADPEACVVVSPADQLIQDTEAFERQILNGLAYVDAHAEFLAMGVKPTMPNTAYGYIQMGEEQPGSDCFRVLSFSEKPELTYARMFLESGEFLWNTGIFLWKGRTMGTQLSRDGRRQDLPVEAVARQMVTIAEEMEYVRSSFNENMPHQLDLFILEHCQNVSVQVCNFGWADVGCWKELREVSRQDADGNVVSGGSGGLLSGSQNCMVRLPEGMKAVVAGLDNYVVAVQDNVLMVCPNENPDAVRRLINEAQMNL